MQASHMNKLEPTNPGTVHPLFNFYVKLELNHLFPVFAANPMHQHQRSSVCFTEALHSGLVPMRRHICEADFVR